MKGYFIERRVISTNQWGRPAKVVDIYSNGMKIYLEISEETGSEAWQRNDRSPAPVDGVFR